MYMYLLGKWSAGSDNIILWCTDVMCDHNIHFTSPVLAPRKKIWRTVIQVLTIIWTQARFSHYRFTPRPRKFKCIYLHILLWYIIIICRTVCTTSDEGQQGSCPSPGGGPLHLRDKAWNKTGEKNQYNLLLISIWIPWQNLRTRMRIRVQHCS